MKPTLINTAMCLCIVCVCELSLGIQWFMLIQKFKSMLYIVSFTFKETFCNVQCLLFVSWLSPLGAAKNFANILAQTFTNDKMTHLSERINFPEQVVIKYYRYLNFHKFRNIYVYLDIYDLLLPPDSKRLPSPVAFVFN